MKTEPHTRLSLEWVKSPNEVALVFDRATWKVFEQTARLREQSPEHMITRAVVDCLGQIVEDNMVQNRILRGSG
jgi:hypothetical protein